MKVFITDAHFKHTLGAVRALAREGVEVHAGSDVVTSLSFYSKYVSKCFVCPRPALGAPFLRAVERIDAVENYDVILPVSNDAWFGFMTGGSRLLDKVPAPPLDSYMVACDKVKTLAFAQNHGVSVPNTVFPGDPESRIARMRYPVVMKPALGSKNTLVFHRADEALAYRRGLQRLGKAAVFQEFVHGEGYGFFALYSHGKRKTFFMHRRIREMPPSGGPSSAAEAVYVPELLSAGTRILDLLAWHGVAMVEFRKNAQTGKFELLEINPKLWGSLDLALAAGINFPYLAACTVASEACNPPATYCKTKFCWPIPDDFRHLRKQPTSMPAVLHDWLSIGVKKNVWLSDLKPHLALVGILTRISAKHSFARAIALATATKPRLFSWVVPDRIAASKRPNLPAQLIWLRTQGVNTILDLTEKPVRLERALAHFGVDYLNVPMRDHAPPTMTQLDRAVSFVMDETTRGRRVLIHCLGGLGRTGVVLACCLMRSSGIGATEAMRAIRQKRPRSIEPLQESSVDEYAEHLHDRAPAPNSTSAP